MAGGLLHVDRRMLACCAPGEKAVPGVCLGFVRLARLVLLGETSRGVGLPPARPRLSVTMIVRANNACDIIIIIAIT